MSGVAVHVPPSWLAPAVRATRPTVRHVRPVAAFERDDGRTLRLLAGYREYGKARWRKAWWPTRALLALDDRGVLPERARESVDALRRASTLPAPVGEFAALAGSVADEAPDVLAPTGRIDDKLGVPVLAPVPRPADIDHLVRLYASGARQVGAALEALGVPLSGARVLEAGCGRGYTAAALVGLAAGDVAGVDLDVPGDAAPAEIASVRTALAGGGDVHIETGDLRALPYPDESFDAVYSLAVLEHVDDLGAAFRELRRVTRPGGVGYHGIDQWFGPAGGHSLCTLDAPWGHTRLEGNEVERYLRELRPHEADDAIDLYRHGFQQPRLTMREIAATASAAGFEVVSATLLRLPLRDPHRGWFSGEVLRECRRVYPAARQHDLLASSVTLILRRR